MACRGGVTVLKMSPNLRKSHSAVDPTQSGARLSPAAAPLQQVMATALKAQADCAAADDGNLSDVSL